MRIEEQVFSAKVDLPCKIFCGPGSALELSGTATSIETGRLYLDLGALYAPWQPVVGDSVKLELSMPVDFEPTKAKYLSVRARVASVEPGADGSQRLELVFRKPVFRDRAEVDAARDALATDSQWEM
jgi:hypothetical protein